MEKVIRNIYENYGFNAQFLEEFPTGTYGVTIKLKVNDELYVLKMILYEENTALNYILPLMHFIGTHGVSVPCPVRTIDGQLYCSTVYELKSMFMYLYPMLVGENLEDSINTIIQNGLTKELGKMVADFHEIIKKYPREELKHLKTWEDSESLFVIFEDINEKISKDIVEVYNKSREDLNQLNLAMDEVIHCDLHTANILYDSEKESFNILDMEDCVLGSRVMDISVLCFDLSVICSSKESWQKGFDDLLLGYESITSLTEIEKAAIPTLVKLLETASYINFYKYKEEEDSWMQSFYKGREKKILHMSII